VAAAQRLRGSGGAAGVVGARAALGEAVDAALASLGRIFAALDCDRVGVLVPAKVPPRPPLQLRPRCTYSQNDGAPPCDVSSTGRRLLPRTHGKPRWFVCPAQGRPGATRARAQSALRAQLRRDGGIVGELGAAILSTCAPAGNRRAVQELAFNKLRFYEARGAGCRCRHRVRVHLRIEKLAEHAPRELADVRTCAAGRARTCTPPAAYMRRPAHKRPAPLVRAGARAQVRRHPISRHQRRRLIALHQPCHHWSCSSSRASAGSADLAVAGGADLAGRGRHRGQRGERRGLRH